jgi:hypothetical protein
MGTSKQEEITVIPDMEIISDNDAEKLLKLLRCINDLWEDARKKGKIKIIDGEKIFDNYALDRFISDLALLLDDVETNRHIRDYIVGNKAIFKIEVSVKR